VGGAIFTLKQATLRKLSYASTDLVLGGAGTPPSCPAGADTVGCPGAGGAAAIDGNSEPASGGAGGAGGKGSIAKPGARGPSGAPGKLAVTAEAGPFGTPSNPATASNRTLYTAP
jgi:hypothetical protein